MNTYLPTVQKAEAKPLAGKLELLILLMNAGWQKRVEPVAHSLLMLAAQRKADDMARRNYFSHTSPDGFTANQNVRSAGYLLPPWYPVEGNNVESLYIGPVEPEEAVTGWFNSPKHHNHVTGDDKFYAGQTAVGIGGAKAKDGRQIYVFVSAPLTAEVGAK